MMSCLEIWKHRGIEIYSHIALLNTAFHEVSAFHEACDSKNFRLRAIPSPFSTTRLDVTHDWKGRFRTFYQNERSFREPFHGCRIRNIKISNDVGYLAANLMNGDEGVYCEVEVKKNPDNLSLSVVDFDAGGKSSVTFSPDTGAVIKETKVQETPRVVSGSFTHCLEQTSSRFRGRMGIYLKDGLLAFFRKGPRAEDPWLTTNFCTSIGDILTGNKKSFSVTPCLAFRDVGKYDVSIVKVCRTPPIEPLKVSMRWQELKWDNSSMR